MENLKSSIIKTCGRLKLPLKIFFLQLDFMLGYYILCGVYALLIGEVLNNFKDKKISRSKYRLLIIFIIGVLSSYIVTNYNIYQLIFF